MMRIFCFFCGIILCTTSLFAQLSGEIETDGRKMITPFDYKVKGTQSGVVVVEIAVNGDGDVTSVVVLKNESNIVSTPTHMMVKEAVKKLKFEKGYHFPKFHRGKMKIIVEQEV